MEKAQKAEFKNQKKQALNAYLDVLYICKQEGTTDRDFVTGEVNMPNGRPVTIEYIKKKAKKLGWKDGVSCDNNELEKNKKKTKPQYQEKMTADGRYIID